MSYATAAKVLITAAVIGAVGYAGYTGYMTLQEKRLAEKRLRQIERLKSTLGLNCILINVSMSLTGLPDVVKNNHWAMEVIKELFRQDHNGYLGASLESLEKLKKDVVQVMVMLGLEP